MNWLLLFVPVAIALEHLAPERHLLVFVASALAIVPLAGWMGRATEQLADAAGEGVGGLLNATFGNAAELIIAFAALRAGLHDVVKASIAGSIIGNILLVLGAAMLAGGFRHREQHYNAAGARSQATMLTLAAIALILPAAYHAATGVARAEVGPSASRSRSCCSPSTRSTWCSRWSRTRRSSRARRRGDARSTGRLEPRPRGGRARGRDGRDRVDERDPGRRDRAERGARSGSTTRSSACSSSRSSATPRSTRPPSRRP